MKLSDSTRALVAASVFPWLEWRDVRCMVIPRNRAA